ncbi:MAG TPA: aspartyl/asparaginyl beta-hydroxylase domain-containing protein [Burkholderiales bacterium]|nr:aspartyl/asparaginyl beta-hydroxylase domain-containing protein [Burkholderiales bacterium]
MPAARATYCRLPLCCDIVAFKRDIAQFADPEWRSHFNTEYHDGSWTGIALQAGEDAAQALYPDPAAKGRFRDTPQFALCPSIREFVAQLSCPVHSVRLLRLRAGGTIREHRDDDLGFDQGEVRLHVPIETNPQVEFYLDGERIPMAEGECWYLDFSLPHRVQNRGDTDRIHLVIDCSLNEWLRALFPTPEQLTEQRRDPRIIMANAGSSARQLELFRDRVLRDAALQKGLRNHQTLDDFVLSVVAAGVRHGFDFTPDDVHASISASRRAWIERWIVK